MDQPHDTPNLLHDYLQGRISRSHLLKAAVAGAAAVAIPGIASADTTGTGGSTAGTSAGWGRAPYTEAPFFPQVTSGSYTPESVTEIVSNVLTWAYFEVAASTFILSTPPLASALGLTGLPLAFLQAFNLELQSHIDFWSKVAPSAAPKATTFTVDPSLVPGPLQALQVFEVASSIRVGLMLAAVREFAELGQPTLAKYAAQTEGMYAEERAVARTLQAVSNVSSAVPPNNKAFETDLFLYTRDAVTALTALGFIGGKGVTVPYPGRDKALAASGNQPVIQRTPNNASSTVAITGLASFLAERT